MFLVAVAKSGNTSNVWTVGVGKVSLINDAVSPMAKLSVVATIVGQNDLMSVAERCVDLSLATAADSSMDPIAQASKELKPIAQLSKELSEIRIEVRMLQLQQLIKCMQLSILVERLAFPSCYFSVV